MGQSLQLREMDTHFVSGHSKVDTVTVLGGYTWLEHSIMNNCCTYPYFSQQIFRNAPRTHSHNRSQKNVFQIDLSRMYSMTVSTLNPLFNDLILATRVHSNFRARNMPFIIPLQFSSRCRSVAPKIKAALRSNIDSYFITFCPCHRGKTTRRVQSVLPVICDCLDEHTIQRCVTLNTEQIQSKNY